MNGMNTPDAALATLRGDVIDIVLGTVFLTVGATQLHNVEEASKNGVTILFTKLVGTAGNIMAAIITNHIPTNANTAAGQF